MAKYGVELSVDVTKIDKARLFHGKKGKYLTMTVFIDVDQKDQYENNGMITHKKNEGEEGHTPILGNCKVFWSDKPQQQQAQQPQQQPQQYAQQQQPMQQPATQQPTQSFDDFDDDIPF